LQLILRRKNAILDYVAMVIIFYRQTMFATPGQTKAAPGARAAGAMSESIPTPNLATEAARAATEASSRVAGPWLILVPSGRFVRAAAALAATVAWKHQRVLILQITMKT